MNKATIIGNLTANPQSRLVNSANGTSTVCNFTVATNRPVRGKIKTTFFRVTCWNKQADNAMKYLARGRKVAVTGPVEASAYIAQDGSARAQLEVYAEEIEYLSSRQEDSQTQAPPPDDSYAPMDDGDLPF